MNDADLTRPAHDTAVSETEGGVRKDWIAPLDGLRAVAVLFVMIHHTNGAYITGWAVGNIGVAVFFSISGFLAYYVLHRDEQRLGHVDYNYFLLRRVLRIWPACLTVIGLVWAYEISNGTFVAGSGNLSLLTFTSNLEMSAFHQWPTMSLAVLWSIAVEEQFYLLAPLMYLALRSRFALVFAAAVVVAANVIRFVYVAESDATDPAGGLYYATYAYADTFLSGAIIAHCYVRQIRPPVATWIVALASAILLVVIARLWGLSVFPPYPWFAAIPYLLLPIAGASVLVAAIWAPAAWWTKVLSFSAIRRIGTLSYGLYLLHVFILTLVMNRTQNPILVNFLFFPSTFVAAWCLYRGIEAPFLVVKDRLRSWRGVLPLPALVSGSTVAFGIILFLMG
jgi:peptidoglycan/LPS O-acetylase OafA/YrhL